MSEKNKYEELASILKSPDDAPIDMYSILGHMMTMQDEFITDSLAGFKKDIGGIVGGLLAEQSKLFLEEHEKLRKLVQSHTNTLKKVQDSIMQLQNEVNGHESRIKILEDKIRKVLAPCP